MTLRGTGSSKRLQIFATHARASLTSRAPEWSVSAALNSARHRAAITVLLASSDSAHSMPLSCAIWMKVIGGAEALTAEANESAAASTGAAAASTGARRARGGGSASETATGDTSPLSSAAAPAEASGVAGPPPFLPLRLFFFPPGALPNGEGASTSASTRGAVSTPPARAARTQPASSVRKYRPNSSNCTAPSPLESLRTKSSSVLEEGGRANSKRLQIFSMHARASFGSSAPEASASAELNSARVTARRTPSSARIISAHSTPLSCAILAAGLVGGV